jgi:hypothetical protein
MKTARPVASYRCSQNAAGAGYQQRARRNRRYEESDESEKRASRNSGDLEPHRGHHALQQCGPKNAVQDRMSAQ